MRTPLALTGRKFETSMARFDVPGMAVAIVENEDCPANFDCTDFISAFFLTIDWIRAEFRSRASHPVASLIARLVLSVTTCGFLLVIQ